jgi:hypothetical protein
MFEEPRPMPVEVAEEPLVIKKKTVKKKWYDGQEQSFAC